MKDMLLVFPAMTANAYQQRHKFDEESEIVVGEGRSEYEIGVARQTFRRNGFIRIEREMHRLMALGDGLVVLM